MLLDILSLRPLRAHFRKLDWPMIICSVLLAGIGLVALYSSSLRKGDFFNFKKQIIFFVVGLILMFIISFFNYRILRNNPYLILILYFISLLLLVGVFFLAPEIRGKRGWYKLGGLSFDPIEPAKLILIILLAKYFSMRHVEMYSFRHIIFSGIYVVIPSLLMFLQPDMGSVIILMIIWLATLLISGIRIKHFLILCFCAILVVGFSWQFLLKDYQKDRISSFLFPKDPLGSSWSQNQAEIAIGSGQIFGQGFTKGSQTQYGFLPEPHTDFIFASFAEEFGLVGVLVMLSLYFILIWRIIRIAITATSNFPRLFASGFAIILIAHFSINIGMNLGLLPVIGIYLPLVSYGGSGLIGTFVGLGLLQSMKVRV